MMFYSSLFKSKESVDVKLSFVMGKEKNEGSQRRRGKKCHPISSPTMHTVDAPFRLLSSSPSRSLLRCLVPYLTRNYDNARDSRDAARLTERKGKEEKRETRERTHGRNRTFVGFLSLSPFLSLSFSFSLSLSLTRGLCFNVRLSIALLVPFRLWRRLRRRRRDRLLLLSCDPFFLSFPTRSHSPVSSTCVPHVHMCALPPAFFCF